jgi:3-deoxy-7-phosphoheptulonate synthase
VDHIRGLYSPGCVRYDIPLTPAVAQRVVKWRQEIEDVLHGTDDRVVAVVGPCSIHDPAAALEVRAASARRGLMLRGAGGACSTPRC